MSTGIEVMLLTDDLGSGTVPVVDPVRVSEFEPTENQVELAYAVPAGNDAPRQTTAQLDEEEFDDFDEEDFDDDFDDDFEDEEDDFDYGAQELEGDVDEKKSDGDDAKKKS